MNIREQGLPSLQIQTAGVNMMQKQPREKDRTMKTQPNSSKLSVLVALVFLATVLAASPAQAIIIICKSGMIGFTTGQTARVNVVNYGDPDDRPVEVSVKFLNKDGNVLGEFRLPDPL
jgi:hypothetical protein